MGPSDPYRGFNDPLQVMQGECKHPLHQAFLTAGEQVNYYLLFVFFYFPYFRLKCQQF